MTSRCRTVRVTAESVAQASDDVAVEAPLAIVIDGVPVVTTMRTPGHDLELAAGWLTAETQVSGPEDLVTLRSALATDEAAEDDPAPQHETGRLVDTVHVRLARGIVAPQPRSVVTSSACGVCSAPHLATVSRAGTPARSSGWSISRDEILAAPARMRAQQRAFARTGGLHAAALIDGAGSMVVREDVGRHNAVDKVIGSRMLAGALPLTDQLLAVSGRASFEIVQKAIAAGVAGVVAVSAPSSMAVDVARRHGLLLAGFVDGTRANVYAGADLVRSAP